MAYIFPNADVVSSRILSTQKQLNPPMCLLVGHRILLAIIRGGPEEQFERRRQGGFRGCGCERPRPLAHEMRIFINTFVS